MTHVDIFIAIKMPLTIYKNREYLSKIDMRQIPAWQLAYNVPLIPIGFDFNVPIFTIRRWRII